MKLEHSILHKFSKTREVVVVVAVVVSVAVLVVVVVVVVVICGLDGVL